MLDRISDENDKSDKLDELGTERAQADAIVTFNIVKTKLKRKKREITHPLAKDIENSWPPCWRGYFLSLRYKIKMQVDLGGGDHVGISNKLDIPIRIEKNSNRNHDTNLYIQKSTKGRSRSRRNISNMEVLALLVPTSARM